jgi:hypothetical protein
MGGLESAIKAIEKRRAAMVAEVKDLDGVLRKLTSISKRRGHLTPPENGREHKWKPGQPGRPPNWYLEKVREEGGVRKMRKKAATPRQIAALEKARAALAVKRAAAKRGHSEE